MPTLDPNGEIQIPGSGFGPAGEEISQFVRELVEAWNSHDAGRVQDFYAPEYEGTDVGQAMPYHGPQGASRHMSGYLRAFPDLSFTQDEIIVQGARVALFWTAHGTHEGKLMNIPPTGKKIAVHGASQLVVQNGQVIRGLYIWDVAGLLRTIGLLPEL
ncbi:MAG TPA: ester cyclase [Rubrobacteraceae bacterium]|nr:ester cyclase [Rubrobacteraceae bacterium]